MTSSDVAAGTSGRLNLAYVWLISLSAALGGLLFGYDWVVIGGAKPFFERYFDLTDPALRGWANSCALVGCLLGAMAAGTLSERLGRKRPLIFSALLFAVTSAGIGTAESFGVFVAWRILGGVAIGLASNLSPLYIAEIAPAHLRGRLVSINQLTIVIGILAAQLVNYAIAESVLPGTAEEVLRTSWNVRSGWRWMFAATAVPSVVFLVTMLFVPESPRWLVKMGRAADARRIITRIGGEGYAAGALGEIQATLAEDRTTGGVRELLDPRLRRVLVLGVVLAVFQQWCGINVIFNYAEEIFSAAGYDISNTLANIAWTGSVNLVFTFVALGVVDRGGRRPLMQIGAGGLAGIYLVLGAGYALGVTGLPMLLLVLAAIGTYSMSLAPVTWVIIAEIFPNRVRAAAMSVAVTALWTACFILTYTFPLLNVWLGPAGTFWIYAGICVAGFLFIRLRLAETKGRSLESIEAELAGTTARG